MRNFSALPSNKNYSIAAMIQFKGCSLQRTGPTPTVSLVDRENQNRALLNETV